MATSEASTRPPLPASPALGSDLWRLGLLFSAWFFLLLGGRPLANPDEGRYVEIAREMVASGDYLTPRLNGVKYFEKPPLVYWLNAATVRLFGVTELGARFWSAAFAVAGVLLVYAAARALHGRAAGWWSAIVLGTSTLYYALSRLVLLDLVVTVWIAAALLAFFFGVRAPPGRRRRRLFWACYAAMALATMTKGLIGVVLPVGVIGLWILLLDRCRMLRPFHPWSGLAIFGAIALPWHVLVARANPDFLYFYFVHEHFLRFTTEVHHRDAAWWYFVGVLAVGLFPWTGFLPGAGRRAFSGGWRQRHRNEAAWLFGLWLVVILLFFSASHSKLAPYILPVFPAASVLIGSALARAWRRPAESEIKTGLLAFAAGAAVLGAALFLVPLPARYAFLAPALQPWRLALGAVLAGGAIAVMICVWRRAWRAGLVAMVTAAALFLPGMNPLAAALDARSTRSLALALRTRLRPDDTVYCVSGYFQDLPAYLGRLVSVVGYEGELEFGIAAEPARSASRFMDAATFRAHWRTDPTAYAVIERVRLPDWFGDPSLPRTIVAETPRHLLLVNHSPETPPRS